MESRDVYILHMSDLHFGANGFETVWPSLEKYVNKTLQPDLILVTGDIVDSPNREHYEEAKKKFDQLGAKHGFLVCPGNHDRHYLGNALGPREGWWSFVRRFWEKNRPPNQVEAWFDQVFSDHMASVSKPERLRLGESPIEWNVCLLGLDSSMQAEYSAQGFVPLDKMQEFQNLSQTMTDADLVILLEHHHLLPIAELESSRQEAAGLLGATTIMLNAGSLLEALTKQSINLVLHGHEHCRALARYVSLNNNQGEVTVVGAGSATGMVTLKGCDAVRASMNLITLKPDRTVWLQKVECKKSQWAISDESPQLLFDSRAIRRARIMRRTDRKGPPTSRIVKSVEFTSSRNILLRETRTNWTLSEPRWTLLTRNATGKPCSPLVSVRLDHGLTLQAPGKDFVFDSQNNAHRFDAEFKWTKAEELARQIYAEWVWLAGAILTKEDLDLIPMQNRGPYRNIGLEHAGIQPNEGLDSFTLMVTIPPEFAPNADDVQVYVETPKGYYPEHGVDSVELTRQLDFAGTGRFSLTVPFPLKDHTYVIGWKLRSDPTVSSEIEEYRNIARKYGDNLIDAFLKALGDDDLMKDFSAALYVCNDRFSKSGIPRQLDRVGCYTKGSTGEPEQFFRLDDRISYHAPALWGEPLGLVAESSTHLTDVEKAAGFINGERTLTMIPLRDHRHGSRGGVWGILRLATRSEWDTIKVMEALDSIQAPIADGIIHLQHELINLNRKERLP